MWLWWTTCYVHKQPVMQLFKKKHKKTQNIAVSIKHNIWSRFWCLSTKLPAACMSVYVGQPCSLALLCDVTGDTVFTKIQQYKLWWLYYAYKSHKFKSYWNHSVCFFFSVLKVLIDILYFWISGLYMATTCTLCDWVNKGKVYICKGHFSGKSLKSWDNFERAKFQ